MLGSASKRYSAELRERAVQMVVERRRDCELDWAAMTQMAMRLGVGTPDTIRKWCRQAEVDGGKQAGVTTEESAELKRLERESAELQRADAILKSASVFFAADRRRSGLTTRSGISRALMISIVTLESWAARYCTAVCCGLRVPLVVIPPAKLW